MYTTHYTMTTAVEFEAEKNRKAFLYTCIICGTLLLLFFLISWKTLPPTVPVVNDLIEINLGNDENGFGQEQPLIKGNRAPAQPTVVQARQAAPKEAAVDKVTPEDNAPEDAAPVTKLEKKTPKIKTPVTPAPVVPPTPKPQKPKAAYNGPGKDGGNNTTQDNGYKYQGTDPNNKGDNGSPNGNKDSYGTTPGGKIGGPRVIAGNRKINRYYNYAGNLPKATIYAVIRVSPSGKGTFIRIVKPSTSFDQRYGVEIADNLRTTEFDKANDESEVTVQFNFIVKQ